MSSLSDKNALIRRNSNRYAFLRKLFSETGGAHNAIANMWEIGTELSLSRVETNDAFDYLRGEGLLEPMTLGGGIRMTHAGVVEVEASIEDPDRATSHFTTTVIYNFSSYHGPVVQQSGSSNQANVGSSHQTIENSTVGAAAAGAGATATGSISTTPSQDQHKVNVTAAQAALVRDQDALDAIDGKLFEALNQFLSIARKIQVDQLSMKDAQAKMKETLDDVWAEQAAKGMKPQLLPKTLEVAEALLKNPLMLEAAKKLIGV